MSASEGEGGHNITKIVPTVNSQTLALVERGGGVDGCRRRRSEGGA
jgi:hypothetical protein